MLVSVLPKLRKAMEHNRPNPDPLDAGKRAWLAAPQYILGLFICNTVITL